MRLLERSVVWRSLVEPGLDHCRLWRHDDGWSLEGTVVTVLEDRPTTVRYEVVCDRTWATRSVVVRAARGSDAPILHLHIDRDRRWWSGGTELEFLHGCLDVDLGITPATNTLPIRRFRFDIGERQSLKVAWVRFPGLEIRPLPQTYTRVDEDRYRYESESGFSAEIEVDDVGIVTAYPGLWETIATE